MKSQYLNFKIGLLFPFQFQVLGYALLFSGLFLVVINIWASMIFILLGGFIVSAFSGVEFKNEHFREYNAFFFLKSGKWMPLHSVEEIFIKPINLSQKMYGRANQSSTIRNTVYKAFLKFENGNIITLYENKNKDKTKSKLTELSNYLGTDIVDYTR
jgi:hypothetical protein